MSAELSLITDALENDLKHGWINNHNTATNLRALLDALASKDEEIAALNGALTLVKHENLKLRQALQGDADVSR